MADGLPVRFHIGTGRAGSTFLFHLIKKHPDISLPLNQEIGFFTDYFDNGLEWYRSCFPDHGVRVDTSPAYFSRPQEAVARMKSVYGSRSLRMLIILRNPVDFLHSYYEHLCRQRKIPVGPDGKLPTLRQYVESNEGFVAKARYCTILEKYWFQEFPRDSFKIVFFEEFIMNPQHIANDILKFWGFSEINIDVNTKRISENQALRYSWLYGLRGKIVKIRILKELLKDSKLFNMFYSKFLVKSDELSRPDREVIWKFFENDCKSLKSLLNRDDLPWR